MRVRVQFFSRLREVVGSGERECEVSADSTVNDLLTVLYNDHPSLREWDAHLLAAIGVEYVSRDQVIREGETILLFPPVQGG
ncbi:MAG: MoaD/ThiS family protein [Chthoniobacteraceae bacterium]